MADNSGIEWTDATWNPITGCSVVSPGCTNCYAMKLAGGRMQHHWSRAGLTEDTKAGPVWNGEVRFNEAWLDLPLRWKRPRSIFVCAHGDLFHEDVPDDWIDRVFAIMARAKDHRFQVLTKRPERMQGYLLERPSVLKSRWAAAGASYAIPHPPLPNVWLGISAEDQRRADERVPPLLDTPAALRFISAEPLLGPIDLTRLEIVPDSLDDRGELRRAGIRLDALRNKHVESGLPRGFAPVEWVIAGGESGADARPMHPAWARSVRDQCIAGNVPFFFKQWGEWGPAGDWPSEIQEHYDVLGSTAFGVIRVGKKRTGRQLDGREWNQVPDFHA